MSKPDDLNDFYERVDSDFSDEDTFCERIDGDSQDAGADNPTLHSVKSDFKSGPFSHGG